jgi:hypothetical protein
MWKIIMVAEKIYPVRKPRYLPCWIVNILQGYGGGGINPVRKSFSNGVYDL